MHSNRLLVLFGGCLLAASAAMADDLGSVDCASHPDATPVYAKARKSQDIVANVPCGEKFKVLLYGFIFSQVQTSDGKIGFIFSNLVTVDRSGGTLQARAASDAAPRLSTASETTKVPADPKPYSAPAQPKRAPASAADIADKMGGSASVVAQPASNPAPVQDSAASAPTTPVPTSAPAASAASATSAQPAPASTQPAPAAAPAPAPAASFPDSSAVLKANSNANAEAALKSVPAPQTQAAPVDAASAPAAPANTSAVDASAPASAPSATEQPVPAADAQPAAAEPAPAPVKSGKVKSESWERPNQTARSLPLVELFGGFSIARADGGGVYNNLLGGVGSFAWNAKPWIQVVGDSSYNVTTISGTKNVLWGNHYGARYFFRGRFPFHVTPFAEGLIGGSRVDATTSGTTYSQNCLSYKIGGGLDMHSPHIRMFEVRLIDFDYYRTAFGTNVHQNNYWISTGVVFRLFGGRSAD